MRQNWFQWYARERAREIAERNTRQPASAQRQALPQRAAVAQEHDHVIYALVNKRLGTLYVGVTNDLERRVEEHRAGKDHTERQRHWLGRYSWEPWKIEWDLTEAEAYGREPGWIRRYNPPANTMHAKGR